MSRVSGLKGGNPAKKSDNGHLSFVSFSDEFLFHDVAGAHTESLGHSSPGIPAGERLTPRTLGGASQRPRPELTVSWIFVPWEAGVFCQIYIKVNWGVGLFINDHRFMSTDVPKQKAH